MNPTLRRFLCLLGHHQWRSDGDTFQGSRSGRCTTMIWWYCPHCWATRLQFIRRDDANVQRHH